MAQRKAEKATTPDVARPEATGPRPDQTSELAASPGDSSQLLGRLLPAQAQTMLTAVGRLQGNRQAQALVGVQRDTGYSQYEVRDDEDESDQRDRQAVLADEVPKSLQYMLDTHPDRKLILSALSGHSRATSQNIEANFQAWTGNDLRARIKTVFNKQAQAAEEAEEDLVRAWALLRQPHYHDFHVAIGLALIPRETRDKELFRLLNASAKVGSQSALRSEYDATFADLGRGSLDADLAGDLNPTQLKKAVALMDHSLSDAERLWLYMQGEKEEGETGLGIVERNWAAGPGAFHTLKKDWDAFVVGRNGWTSNDLRYDIQESMKDDNQKSASLRIYRGYQAFMRDLTPEEIEAIMSRPEEGDAAAPLSYEEQDRNLETRIATEQRLVELSNPEGDAAPDEARYFASLEKIQALTHERITLAKSNGDLTATRTLEEKWTALKRQLLASVNKAYDDPKSDGAMRGRLLLEGNLTPADKVWIKAEAFDAPGVVAAVTEAWATRKSAELIGLADISRLAPDGTVIRPKYQLGQTVKGGVEDQGGKAVRALIEAGYSEPGRGRRRLAEELGGTADRDLRGAYEFLSTPGIDPALRDATIAEFVRFDLKAMTPEMQKVEAVLGQYFKVPSTPTERFLNWLEVTYPNAITVWDFYDLLAPSQDIDEIVRRAQKRTDIVTTGFSAGLAELLDLGGEDTIATTKESMERLQYLKDIGLQAGDIQLLLAMTGTTNVSELAGVEYDLFKERAQDAMKARKDAVDAFVFAAEFAVDTWLGLVMPGYPLIAGLGSSLAGIITRQVIEGKEADPLTQENLLKFVAPVWSQYTGAVSGKVGGLAFWNRAGKAGPLLAGTAENIVGQAGDHVANLIFTQKLPSAQELATGLASIPGGLWAKHTASAITNKITKTDDWLKRAEFMVQANLYSSVISNTTGVVAKAASGALDDKHLSEIGIDYGTGLGQSQLKGLFSGLLEARQSLLDQKKKNEEEEGFNTTADSPLAERDGFEVVAAPDDEPDRMIFVSLGEVQAPVKVLYSGDGEADFQVDTRHGEMPLRDVLLAARPGPEWAEMHKKQWIKAAATLVELEQRADELSEGKVRRGLMDIFFTLHALSQTTHGTGQTLMVL